MIAPRSPRDRLRAVVDAYVRPLLTCGGDDPNCDAIVVMKFLGKVLVDLTEHAHMVTYYEGMRNGFIDAIQRCLPELSNDETVFCYHSMVAVLLFYALGNLAHIVRVPSNGDATANSPSNPEDAINMLCAFICDGMPSAAGSTSKAALSAE
jgi:hypothetical protein